MKKRLISFVVAMAMMFSLMGMTTMAAPAADILATDFSLTVTDNKDGTIDVVMAGPAVTGFYGGEGKMDVKDSQGNSANAYFTLNEISTTDTVLKDKDTDLETAKWFAYANDETNGDTLTAGTWFTYKYSVDEDTPADTYSFEITIQDLFDYAWETYSCVGATVKQTYTIESSGGEGGDQPGGEGGDDDGELSYTASLSCDTETVMAPGAFEVEVLVDKPFASAEFTVEYDNDLLTFQGSDSVLYDAKYTKENGKLKFWDYGETQEHGYLLCFKASGDAGEAEVELTEAAFSTKDEASSEDLTRAAITSGTVTVEITVPSEDLTIEVEGAEAAGVEIKADHYYEVGKDVTIELDGQESGYVYNVIATVNDQEVDVIDNGDGTYTIEGENVVAGGIVFTVTKVLDTSSVKVSQYVKMDGATMYLVTCGTAIDGKVYTYGGAPMFWSDSYDSYCYLVIATSTFSTDAAKTQIGLKNGTAVAVSYDDVDVNMSNKEDANDAQLVYNMYNAMYADFSVVPMEKFLRADVETDKVLNVDDAAAIIAALK